jgi:hypothetical protein
VAVHYLSSVGWTAVTAWAALTAYGLGTLRRQLAAVAVGNERVFQVTTGGVSGAAEPAWTLTDGGTTNDGTVVWTEVTGDAAVNWTGPYARLVTIAARAVAGDTIYIAHDHAETQAATMALSFNGSTDLPVRVICVNSAGSVPPVQADLRTTATVTTTGAFSITHNAGSWYAYGVAFVSSSGAGSNNFAFLCATTWAIWLESCTLSNPSTGSGALISIGLTGTGADDQFMYLKNCSIRLPGHANSSLNLGPVRFIMEGGAFITSSTPTSVIKSSTAATAPPPLNVVLRGVDLSIFGAGKSLVQAQASPGFFLFENCKLGASVSVGGGGGFGPGQAVIWLDNCDSADTQNRMQRSEFAGNTFSETTIVRTFGANNGTTALSWKMTASDFTTLISPLYSPWIAQWNDRLGSPRTITVEIIHDSVTALTDAEVWLEVEALTTSGFPLGAVATDRVGLIDTAVAQTASTVGWTTTGITNVNKQVLSVAVTPQEVGWFRARVALAKPGYTIYVDPLQSVA